MWPLNTGEGKGWESALMTKMSALNRKTLASGSWDCTIKLWDVARAKEKASLDGHADHILSVAFSPDGKILASGNQDTRVAMLYARLGFRYHRRVMNPVFPPPARRVRHLYTRQLAALLLAAGVGLGGVAPAAYQDEGTELKAARQAIERREFPKALDLLAKALKVSPENADLHFLMARTARRAAAFKEAQHHIDECVRLKGSAEAIALERKLLQAQVGELDDVEKPYNAHPRPTGSVSQTRSPAPGRPPGGPAAAGRVGEGFAMDGTVRVWNATPPPELHCSYFLFSSGLQDDKLPRKHGSRADRRLWRRPGAPCILQQPPHACRTANRQ
jgi:hypothetical protein